jgi:hypothetical protein
MAGDEDNGRSLSANHPWISNPLRSGSLISRGKQPGYGGRGKQQKLLAVANVATSKPMLRIRGSGGSRTDTANCNLGQSQ